MPEPWTPEPEPSDAQMLGEALVERATSPAEIARGVRAVFRAPRRVARAALDAAEAAGAFARTGFAAPSSPFNVEIGPYRRFATVSVDLAEMKRDQERRRRHDQRRRPRRGQRALWAATCAPAGTRPASLSSGRWSRSASAPTTSTAPSATGSPPTWRRSRSGATIPRERLALVSETMGDLKRSKQAVGATLMTELTDFAPPTIAGQAARLQSRQRFFNLVVTNIPGPQFPLYLLGRELEAIYPMVPLAKRQAVCFGIMSYNGQVNFGLIGDYDALDDLEALAQDLSASLVELATAVPEQPPSRSRAKQAAGKAATTG